MAKKRRKKAATCAPCGCTLNVKAFALAAGILWAVACFAVGLMASYGYGNAFEQVFASIYIGYSSTFSGAIIGGIWAFVDAFIGGYIFAWLYNRFS